MSDGNHGQTRVFCKSSMTKTEGGSEMEASNVAVLLLVPEKVYMEEMFARHASKHETKEKASRRFSYFCPFMWIIEFR